VNDSLDHPIGDLLLAAVGRRLCAAIRETDTVARLGGDEFALLQTVEGNQRVAAIALASRLLEAVNVPYEIEGNQIMIGTSIGIALAPNDGTEVEQLLKNADLALYRAKAEGRNAYRLFATEMDAEARSRHSLQNDLRASIGRDEFEILSRLLSTRRRDKLWAPRHSFAGAIQSAGRLNPISSSRSRRRSA
jgi:diguanylate cyclase (GGDEF)-like protein